MKSGCFKLIYKHCMLPANSIWNAEKTASGNLALNMSDAQEIAKLQFSRHHPYLRQDFQMKFAVLKQRLNEPRHEKINILHMRKQRRRSALR